MLSCRLLLLDGDQDNSPVKPRPQVKQGDLVYAKVVSELDNITAVPTVCEAVSSDQSQRIQLISKG